MSIDFTEDIGMINLAPFGITFYERVQNASRALQAGKGIILIDDEDRENEGDLIFSTTHLTVEDVNTLIQDCSGIICLCLKKNKANSLNLEPMVKLNKSRYQTAFTNSIESRENITTGVSAQDRWMTIKVAAEPKATSSDIVQPGHVFPIVAQEGGVLSRRGHTEGSIDLMEVASLEPSAVLCELINKDGSMKKDQQLVEYAAQNQLMILSVNDIVEYKSKQRACA